MYKYFYPLLEHIDEHYLIVFDGMLRTLKRNDLTYNCCVHYTNQTPHVLVFQYFPMVQEPDNFMILVDLATRSRYRLNHFSSEYVQLAEIHPVHITMDVDRIAPTEAQKAAYENKKEELFDNIGMRDPNTIPRDLHVWVGTRIKKQHILSSGLYIARNGRFKQENVKNYTDYIPSEKYTVIDFPVNVMQFTDFLEQSGATHLTFLHSGTSVDNVYTDLYQGIFRNMEENFYAEADIPE